MHFVRLLSLAGLLTSVAARGGSEDGSRFGRRAACSAGQVSNGNTCTTCGTGKYADGSKCEDCPKGSYCKEGLKIACPDKTYADKTGQTACTAVGTGCTVNEAKTTETCTPTCTNGQYVNADNKCEECPKGSYCTGGKKIACADKTYADKTGQTACTAAGTGCTVNEAKTTQTCTPTCTDGQYVNAENKCEECPKGSYCTGGKKIACADKTYADKTGQTACTVAGTGCTVNEAKTTQTCTPTCTNGQYVNAENKCEECPKGSYCTGGKKIACADKTYADKTGQTACTAAGTGCTVNEAKTTQTCTPTCTNGQYVNADNKCEECPKGSYCTGGKKIACADKTFADKTGQTACTAAGTGCTVNEAKTTQTCTKPSQGVTRRDALRRLLLGKCEKPGFKQCETLRGKTECIDVMNSLEMCGDCVKPGSPGLPGQGQDCSQIDGVRVVKCARGNCQVDLCGPGYIVSKDGKTCNSMGEL